MVFYIEVNLYGKNNYKLRVGWKIKQLWVKNVLQKVMRELTKKKDDEDENKNKLYLWIEVISSLYHLAIKTSSHTIFSWLLYVCGGSGGDNWLFLNRVFFNREINETKACSAILIIISCNYLGVEAFSLLYPPISKSVVTSPTKKEMLIITMKDYKTFRTESRMCQHSYLSWQTLLDVAL